YGQVTLPEAAEDAYEVMRARLLGSGGAYNECPHRPLLNRKTATQNPRGLLLMWALKLSAEVCREVPSIHQPLHLSIDPATHKTSGRQGGSSLP
ncbi:hypothetical protein FMUND_13989, partial [Fusarium mundagurra]